MYQQMVSFQIGKYDTYKGSTPSFKSSALKLKDSGKYDTYKGSTQSVIISFFTITTPGNMILIKDG